MQRARYNNGFTLVEVLFGVILVGISIACLVATNIASTRANDIAMNLSTAEFLTEQIRELTTLLPVIDPESGDDIFGPESGEILSCYDDVDDFDGANISPPISADREVLNDFSAFTQQVTVENVTAINFEQVIPDHSSDFVRVTVEILFNSEPLYSVNWIRTQY
jgi:prepilin-type N-terminal cleavage/methylation domain-containing protein